MAKKKAKMKLRSGIKGNPLADSAAAYLNKVGPGGAAGKAAVKFLSGAGKVTKTGGGKLSCHK